MLAYNSSIHLALSNNSTDFPDTEKGFVEEAIINDDEIIQLKEWETYYIKFYFETDTALDKLIESYPELKIFQSPNFKQSGTFILDKIGDVYIINFQNYVGLSKIGPIKLNIINRKINEEQYQFLLSDLTDKYIDLVYQFSRTSNNEQSFTGYSTERSFVGKNLNYINFLFLKRFLLNTSAAQPTIREILNLILKEPHFKIQRDFITRHAELIRHFDAHRLMEAVTTGNNLQKIAVDHSLSHNRLAMQLKEVALDGNSYFPITLKEEEKYHSFDTSENRFIKHFLEMLQDLLKEIKNMFENEQTYFNPELFKDIDGIDAPIRNCLDDPLWSEVGAMRFVPTNSQALQRKEGYRQLLSLYSFLQLASRYDFNSMDFESLLESKDTNILYEYWCFFTVKEILEQLLGEPLSVKKYVESAINPLNPQLKEGLWIHYNGDIQLGFNITFNGSACLNHFDATIQPVNRSYSQEYRPDIVIQYNDSYLILDAKHKLTNWNDDTDSQSKPKKEDIDKMHTYREAIVNAVGAYILYPGTRTVIYPVHDARCSHEGVGAIKLVPPKESFSLSENDDLNTLVKQFLEINHV